MDSMYEKFFLQNGMKVVTERMTQVKSVSLGLWVQAGSRDEKKEEHGISHFLEHMFFKGTKSLSAHDIAKETDSTGGELNAFTSRETTTFYATVLDEYLPRAVKLFSDILHDPLFDERDIENEKQVVLEEIKMVEDDPEDYVHDLHTQSIWNGNPLGRSILGTPDVITALTRADMMRHRRRHYRPKDMVIAVAGNFETAPIKDILNCSFGRFRSQGPPINGRRPPLLTRGVFVQEKNLEQVHLCLSTQGLSQGHKDRFGIQVLNTIVGGSLSSRLFQEVREKRGLAYTIYSSLSSFQDVGLCTVYAATGAPTAEKVVSLIVRELKKLKVKGLTDEELARAKSQIKGSIMLEMESTSNRMGRIARDEIYLGRYIPLDELTKDIESVTVDQVMRLARELFQSRHLSVTILGPLSRKKAALEALLAV